MNKGLVHIYTGNGKGKTTAAIGLTTRCAGHNRKVCVYQFLKSMNTGELTSLKKLGIKIVQINSSGKFYSDMTEEEKELTREEIKNNLKALFIPQYDMVVMDEIICAVDLGIVDVNILIDIIKNKPFNTELVLTGRNMSHELLKYADYV
ncbi:MAG: cob(I)yrinic acid a,c-diamide adenosyltransferase, partial [Clostridia bacterium]|nr:cob(I)yrinic acid a,c-diamide adenosyltransferase [Clostridia bacterium]